MREPIDQDERCFCGAKLGEDTLVLIESGQMLPYEKDPKFLRFRPDWRLPSTKWPEPGDPSSVLRRIVHFDCFREKFDRKDVVWLAAPKPHECCICGLDFRSSRWAHRYTFGEIDHDTFIPDPELPIRGIVCGFCAKVLSEDPVDKAEETLTQVTRGQLLLIPS